MTMTEKIKITPEHLSKRYKSVFSGRIGTFVNYKVSLNIDESVRPVQLPPRKPPYHLTKCIEKVLNTQIAEDVIEKAEGLISWLIPCVPDVKYVDSMQIRLTTAQPYKEPSNYTREAETPTTFQQESTVLSSSASWTLTKHSINSSLMTA